MKSSFLRGLQSSSVARLIQAAIEVCKGERTQVSMSTVSPHRERCSFDVPLSWTVTGAVSAKLAGNPVGTSVARLVIGGALGLAVTYGVGSIFDV